MKILNIWNTINRILIYVKIAKNLTLNLFVSLLRIFMCAII